MKIGIVNTDFSMGGVQNICITLAKGFAKYSDHKPVLIDFLGIEPMACPIPENVELIVNKYNRGLPEKVRALMNHATYRYLKQPYRISSHSRSRIKGLAEIISNQHLEVVILSQGYLTAMIPRLKKMLPQVRFIAWQHSSYEIYLEKYNNEYIREYKEGLRLANTVVCLTKRDANKFKAHNPNSTCIYNALPFENHALSSLDSKQILFVGRLDREVKGLDSLVEIIKETNPGYNFKIVGDGPDKNWLENEIKQHKLEKRVSLSGALRKEQLLKEYLNSVAFVLTSRWEGFGLVLIEAMSCGVPVISFNNYGPNEVLNGGEYGILIQSGQTKAFSAELNQLLENKESLKYYQQQGLKHTEVFTLPQIIQKWCQVIQS
ncbi:MAG: glycosyltransferase [Turicibacter sp.]|nr:glycosyltransferase [Turicibacter sp.]